MDSGQWTTDVLKMSEKFDAAVKVGEDFTDAKLAEIPAKRGVVLFVSKDGRPIVLITAADMRSRVRNRLAEPADDEKGNKLDLREITGEILYRQAMSHFEADFTYLQLAAEIFPKRFSGMISWKSPWFISLDIEDSAPRFTVTRTVLDGGGRFFGPFLRGRDAEKYIENLSDVFRLCRDVKCLRQAPNASGCSWCEMGKCVGVGEGKMSMEDYRELLGRAGDFISGDQQSIFDGLNEEMKAAAASLEFEKAGAVKRRIGRLAELGRQAMLFVRPAEQFKYLLIQRGAGRKQCRLFYINGPAIHGPFELACPFEVKAVGKILEDIRKLDLPVVSTDALGRLRMGLVSRTLFGDAKDGLAVHWDGAITAEALAEIITQAADVLNITPTKSKKCETEK